MNRRALREAEAALYRRIRHPSAFEVCETPPGPWRPAELAGHSYCLLVTYKKSGEPVPTPVWFALSDGRIYARSAASDGKVKRIRREPHVLVAPCTFRGRPLGAAFAGEARIIEGGDALAADDALRRRFGLRRRAYQALRDPTLEVAYLAVTPAVGDGLAPREPEPPVDA